MMIKIKKKSGTNWGGNGFGTASASWYVCGAEHIEVVQLGGMWYAIDTKKKQIYPGEMIRARIARGDTRKACLESLADMYPELIA